MPPTPIEERPIDERLGLLHAHYTGLINAAVAAGRMDLVRDLANDCEDEALALMLDAEGDTSQRNQAEVLELGGLPRSRGGRRLGTLASRFWRHSNP
jgi:hypothetical protein